MLCGLSSCSSSERPPLGNLDTIPDAAGASDVSDVVDSLDSSESLPDVPAVDVVEGEAAAALCANGSWGSVPSTQCSLVDQDCALGKTCLPKREGVVAMSSCELYSNGLRTRGQPCADIPDCAAGLFCVNKRCTPLCCAEAQYRICGAGGNCNVRVSLWESDAHVFACSYGASCQLWAKDCSSEEVCHVTTPEGYSVCMSAPPSGKFKGEGEGCAYQNDCGDSMLCFNSACRYLCKLDEAPYEKGDPYGPPGQGGCPSDRTCVVTPEYAAWLGICI